ncbi:SdrD B-like domain-containing protein [Spirosoma foliorum]|uniref:PKD/Chitinase domain-containing protein n=1 Tax=Spirosoma foliorum TaxID=2710596 RepID=A0A7G5GR98_9BACT|nr:SdrD B-like domain-containing protein [Spirosoma foliorum]QMW01390.1 hypothetical protein H3H32_26015 [Spirosoma foliorum]
MKKNLYTKKGDLNRSIWAKSSHLYQIVCLLFFFVALSQTARAQISGAVYRDFNEDGVRSFTAATPLEGEIGVGGVTVNVYNAAGALAGTTVTSSATATAGSYTVTVSGTAPYRVEFVNLPSGYYDGQRGTASGTSVQFVTTSPATGINLGINYPFDYCQAAPNFIVPCYVNGDPAGGGNAGTQPVLVSLPYSSTGNTPTETAVATNVQIGTVFGVAYNRTSKNIYTAAFVKRHSGLGTGGAGAIYITKPGSGTTYTSTVFATLPTAVSAVSPAAIGGTTVVGTNSARGLPTATTTTNYDVSTFDQVGKAGLGDIELSEDGTELYAINLGDRRLYQIPITNANTTNPTAATASITSFTLPAPTQTTGSVLRPFALKVYRGRVYVGAVTTNEAVSTTVNLGTGSTGGTTSLVTRDPSTMVAYVFEFNPVNSSFTTVLSFPLSYTKGATDNDQTGVSRSDRWFPWVSVQPSYPTPTAGQLPNRYSRNDLANASYPQPMLSGIEFDVDGSMILSIRDRFGDQYGNNNLGADPAGTNTQLYRAIAPGDILRAGQCTPGVNLWTLESNARVCGGPATAGANTNQGPGGGEYYYSDAIAIPNTTNPYHLEMSEGGLALFPGTGEVASIVLDPTNAVDAGGVRRFKNSDGSGSPSTSVQIYVSSGVSTFGKANGLGDLELNCDLPPIQIGNRVFRDVNNNGVQDPGEPGLAGVQVVLRGPGNTTIATAVTDANGEYYFSSATGTSTASSIENLTLTAGGSYTLSFPTSVSAFTISAFPNSATGTNGGAIDSDADATGAISITLGTAGQNNFTYDVGYACTPLALTLTSGTICAGQTVSLTATSGFSSYTFSSGLTQVGTTNVASGSVNGTYSVTAVNSFGCTGTASGSITVNALPVVTLSSATICTGQSATLTATSGFTNYTFSSGLTRIGTTNQATGSAASTYSVTVVNSNGCVGVSSTTGGAGTITVNTPPTVTLSSATICAGQTATLTATAGLASYTFSSGLTQLGATNQATGTAANIYSVTATNSVGCSASAVGSITVNPIPTLTLSSATICAGQTATLVAGGTGFASYTFSSGLTQIGSTSQATGTTGGIYSVTATTALGCSTTATGTITVNPLPALTLSSATICAGQTATLTASTGFATYVFSTSLTQGSPTNVASSTAAGVYSVTATTAQGCSATATGSITVNPLPALTLSSATICAGQSATLTASSGFATYVFSSGLTQVGATNQATGTTANTYSVTATTALGCSTTATGSITVNPLPALTLSSATICAGQSATLTATAGFANYVFSTGLTRIGTTNQATGTTTNIYSVTATTALGCSTTATGSITVNPLPTVTLSSATICAGQTATLVAGGTGFATYAFSAGLTQIGSTSQATGTTGGIYSVTATTALGCSTTATGTITVNPLPALTLSSATICAGQSATLTASTGFATYVFSSSLTQGSPTNVASGTAAGVYSVTATTALGCSTTATGTITVNPLPALTLSSATICAGQSATLTATTGFANYVFSTGLTRIGTTNQATGTIATIYSVTATTALGCSTTATGSIIVNPVPALTLSSATICAGQTATLTATSGFATYVFSTSLTHLGTTNQATGTTAGIYSVTATTALGCSTTATGTITVNPLPVVNLTSATVCASQTASLAATAGYASYVFSSGLTQIGTSNVAVGTVGGTYSVTAISTAGCSASATGSIIINANPVVALSSATICAGQTAVLSASTGYDTYIFSAGLTQSGSSNVATGTTAGIYSVTAISNAGCSATATGSITVNPLPVVTLSSATVCAGQSATLVATAGYASYAFSAGLTPVTGQPNIATGLVGSTYSVTATSTEGCVGTGTGSITVNPLPVVNLTSATVCDGQTASLTATAGYASYVFSSGLTQIGSSNVAIGTASGIYSVTAISTEGCSATATGSITINPLPIVTLSSATICAGQTAVLSATSGYTSYIFSTGLTQVGSSNVATGTVGATYSVTAISSAGCSATAAGSITVNPLPVVTLSSATVCAGQSATLVATTGYASYAFSAGLTPMPGQPNMATGSVGGTYSVTATSTEGCVGTGSGSITVNPLPVVTLTSATVCDGQTASLTATAGYASYVFSAGLTQIGSSNVAVGTVGGTYSVTAISTEGCSASATGSITINANPVVTLSSATICAGQTAVLSATTGYDTYLFSAGLTQVGNSNVATGTTAGTYSVTAITTEGCSATTAGSITVNPLPVVTLSSATVCAGQSATLVATAGYASYAFSAGLTQVAGQPNMATGSVGGTYSVTATSTEGCVGTGTGTITVNPLPVVDLSSAIVCNGQTASLTATAGYDTYIFSAGLTQIGSSNVAIGTANGTYSVTAISTEGCSASATGSITINANPVVTLSSATICAGQTATLTATAGYDTYIFSAGLTQSGTSNVATGTVAGIYSVTAISNTGCSATTTGSITVNPVPVVDLSSATVCAGQSATLVATAGYASYAFSAGLTPVPGQPNMATGSVGGTYSVTATSTEGCVGTGTGTITVNPLPVVTLTSATVCDGQTASLTATSGYDTYVFSAGLTQVGTSNVAIGTTTGNYSVTAISTEGCSATATGSITVNPNPVVTLSSATICAGQSATLTATTGYDTYLFSAGLTQVGTSNVATGTTAGVYSVTAISTEGCSATATGSITVNPNPVVTLTSMSVCDGQTASLTATTGYDTYIFSAGLTPERQRA